MLGAVFSTLRFIMLILAGHKQIALENAALRQQLAILKREQPGPKLHYRDRLFWIFLMKIWKQWRTALVIVQPATVVRWQRRQFRQYWWRTTGFAAARLNPWLNFLHPFGLRFRNRSR
ncbi:MAG: hypothetical protein DMG14_09710 [Acidobacteria bacterium]|nr:MAG: hypothetical protein DMG14_09710 [Acidobacteriota bacterium]